MFVTGLDDVGAELEGNTRSSWRGLEPEEHEAIAALSLFRLGFARERHAIGFERALPVKGGLQGCGGQLGMPGDVRRRHAMGFNVSLP